MLFAMTPRQMGVLPNMSIDSMSDPAQAGSWTHLPSAAGNEGNVACIEIWMTPTLNSHRFP